VVVVGHGLVVPFDKLGDVLWWFVKLSY
jgi:hypothetical protein